MEKILVSSQGKTLDDPVDPRFGRAAYFLVVDPETMDFEVLDNTASRQMAQGAGIQAAESAAGSGAKIVLSGFIGPKAFTALQAAGIRIGQGVDGLKVREAIERYQAGQVDMTDRPTQPGHWT
jgi:predicted Fe-Mo cluster-binding NifX family protein